MTRCVKTVSHMTTKLPTLRSFLDTHRSNKESNEWCITGMSEDDKGKYHVSDQEYDTFLKIVHNHIFGHVPRASSLLERHRDTGPLLVDQDPRHGSNNHNHGCNS